MYVSAILVTKPPKKVVIPIQWFQSLDLAQIFNVGASKTKLHKVFFCEDNNADPNFRLEIKEVYANGPACYKAQMKHAFNTFESAENHMKKARPVLGAVYNENLVRYDWHAPDPDDQTCNQTVHVKLEKEVDRLQSKVQQLQRQMAIADLDPGELQDLQETVMDVDDEIASVSQEPQNHIDDDLDNDLFQYDDNSSENSSQNNDSATTGVESNAQSIASTRNLTGVDDSNSLVDSSTTTVSNPAPTSLFDSVAGHMIFVLDGKGDRYFPCADVTISSAIYGLLEFYNDQQKTALNGELFDLKFTNLLMKGIFGVAQISEMDPDNIDLEDAKMQFARDLFTVRVEGNPDRLIFFELHVSKCIEMVKQRLFIAQFKR